MTQFRSIRFAVGIAVLSATAVIAAQAGTQPQGPPMPKPGPEHAMFKMEEVTWNAIVEFLPAPGAPPMTSKGVEVNTIWCMGLCLISDFKAEVESGAFQGH